MLLAKIDEYGKLGWLTITIIGFWLAWPAGLVILAYLAGSGRLRAWRSEISVPNAWFNLGQPNQAKQTRTAWPGFKATPSGNQSFDDYRDETIRGLEQEQREFQDFLKQLRKARDKAEFDAFMTERRTRKDEQGAETPPA